MNATDLQRSYYARTAENFNATHLAAEEHGIALSFLMSSMNHYGFHTILDIGSGTGRVVAEGIAHGFSVTGIEPVKELREIGHASGIAETQLVEGNAARLDFANDSFDVVCAFGVLHHVPMSRTVVSEMLRVAAKAIFISDANNFGQGSFLARTIKQLINSVHLWPTWDYLSTSGKGYHYSEGDGVFYSYSIFNDYQFIRDRCRDVCMMNTKPSGPNLYRTAPTVALLGIKNK